MLDLDLSTALEAVQEALATPNAMVLIAGAGASGNLAYFISRRFSDLASKAGLGANRVAYLVAGGDEAIVRVGEVSAEDDGAVAISDLSIIGESTLVCYIGVSCSLSAVYVASQTEELMRRQEVYRLDGKTVKYHMILIGFNPPEAVARVHVSGFQGTAYETLHRFVTPGWEVTSTTVTLKPNPNPNPRLQPNLHSQAPSPNSINQFRVNPRVKSDTC